MSHGRATVAHGFEKKVRLLSTILLLKCAGLTLAVALALLAATQARAALILDLRFADGGTARQLTEADIGTDITINVYARVTGAPGNTGYEGIDWLYFSAITQQFAGGLVTAGGVTGGVLNDSFDKAGAQSSAGTSQLINADALKDIGSNLATPSPAYCKPRGDPEIPIWSNTPGVTGTATPSGYEFLVETLTFRVTSLNTEAGRTTALNPVVPGWKQSMGVFAASWHEDGTGYNGATYQAGLDQKNSVNAIYQAGSSILFTSTTPAHITLGNVVDALIIEGGTGLLGASVGNDAAPGSDDLNFTLTAGVWSGGATSLIPSPGSGVVVPGSSQAVYVNATSSTVGVNLITLTAGGFASNSPQSINASLTVLKHSNASFSGVSDANSLVIDFGITGGSQNFNLHNLIATLGYTAKLDLDAIEMSGDTGVLSANLAAFSNLAAGSHMPFTATFIGSAPIGTYATYYTLHLSDEDLPGAIGGQTLYLTLLGEVIPEPTTLALLALGGLASIVGRSFRRRRHVVADA